MPMHPKLTYHFHQYPLQPLSSLQSDSSILRLAETFKTSKPILNKFRVRNI